MMRDIQLRWTDQEIFRRSIIPPLILTGASTFNLSYAGGYDIFISDGSRNLCGQKNGNYYP